MAPRKGDNMKIEGVAMPRFNTTLMGVVKGALDYHGIQVDPPAVFGLSGHAFLINIHKRLCPSDKQMESAEKVRLLAETQGKEAEAIGKVAALAASLRSGTP
jgi:hypothetical protein